MLTSVIGLYCFEMVTTEDTSAAVPFVRKSYSSVWVAWSMTIVFLTIRKDSRFIILVLCMCFSVKELLID